MNVIVFIYSKGGVGKSTLTSIYADILPSEKNKKRKKTNYWKGYKKCLYYQDEKVKV